MNCGFQLPLNTKWSIRVVLPCEPSAFVSEGTTFTANDRLLRRNGCCPFGTLHTVLFLTERQEIILIVSVLKLQPQCNESVRSLSFVVIISYTY